MNDNKNRGDIIVRPLLRKEIDKVKEWFSIPTFYFDTHNPNIIKQKDINFFLEFSDSHFCIIEEKNGSKKGSIALFDFTLLRNSGRVEIELQFINYNDWQRIGVKVLNKITSFLLENFDLHKILKMIYGFEKNTIKVFSQVGYKSEGKYNSLTYKDGKYWDVFVYSYFKSNI